MKNSWYDIDFSDIDTPALIVDPEKVKFNINLAIEYAGNVDRLRPHVKTHKILEVAKMQLAAGIHKFKCATIAEAEMLGMAGARDVLVAYPVQGPKIGRLLALQNTFPETQFSVLIDNADSARKINNICTQAGTSLNYYIDINNGQNRTGARLKHLDALLDTLNPHEHLRFKGLHCYDGHIRMASFQERVEVCRAAFLPVLKIKKRLEQRLKRDIALIAGGSPSFSVHAKYHGEIECSPGTFVFWDERYFSNYREMKFQKAAVVATRIISQLDANTWCADLGHKSIASEFPFPRVAFIHPELFVQIGHSEEHLVIQSETPNVLAVGQILLGFPYHICPTVALYDSIYVVGDGKIIDQWEVIARNRKITV